MAIKNFIKKNTYSSIASVNLSKTAVSIQLDVYEDDSKEVKLMSLSYELAKEFPVQDVKSYVKDLSEYKEDEGIIFLFSNTGDKQGYHEFTKKSVKGEKNSFSFIRESLHKESPRFVKIKDVVYEYDSANNKYEKAKNLKGTTTYFDNYFPIGDKNHFELAYNYLISLPEFENCEKT